MAINPDETVEITLDKPRRLHFNLRALRALDSAMGEVGIAKVLDLLRSVNFFALERAIWAGLLHEEPNLQLSLAKKRVETFIEKGGDATVLFRAAAKAVNGSRVFGRPEEEEQGNEQPEAAAT